MDEPWRAAARALKRVDAQTIREVFAGYSPEERARVAAAIMADVRTTEPVTAEEHVLGGVVTAASRYRDGPDGVEMIRIDISGGRVEGGYSLFAPSDFLTLWHGLGGARIGEPGWRSPGPTNAIFSHSPLSPDQVARLEEGVRSGRPTVIQSPAQINITIERIVHYVRGREIAPVCGSRVPMGYMVGDPEQVTCQACFVAVPKRTATWATLGWTMAPSGIISVHVSRDHAHHFFHAEVPPDGVVEMDGQCAECGSQRFLVLDWAAR